MAFHTDLSHLPLRQPRPDVETSRPCGRHASGSGNLLPGYIPVGNDLAMLDKVQRQP